MTTDTSEKGLETLIMRHMTGTDGLAVVPTRVAERPPAYGGTGYTAGSAQDYDRAHALDVPQLFAFLRVTQPEAQAHRRAADRRGEYLPQSPWRRGAGQAGAGPLHR